MVEIKPGPELDTAIAEAIGWKQTTKNAVRNDVDHLLGRTLQGWWDGDDYVAYQTPLFSTDLNEASMAAEKVSNYIIVMKHEGSGGKWESKLTPLDAHRAWVSRTNPSTRHLRSNSQTQGEHGMSGRLATDTPCVVCGSPVRQRRGRPPGKCCSMKCRRIHEARQAVYLTCEQCGKTVRLSPGQAKQNRRHCSKLCQDTSQREAAELTGQTKIRKCRVCDSEFRSVKHHGYWRRYCCRECWNSERKSPRKATCSICGSVFLAGWKGVRGCYEKFCSRPCAAEGSKRGMLVTCVCCGRETYRPLAKLKKSATDFFYCSLECRAQGMVDERCGKSYKHGIAISQNGYTKIARERVLHASPGHRTRRKYQPIHRLIVECVLDRDLTPDEPVWHLDGDLENNLPDNLYLFPTMSSMWRSIGRRDIPVTTNLPEKGRKRITAAMLSARNRQE